MDFKLMLSLLFQKMISRKFIMTMILAIILLVVFFVMIGKDLLTETVFGLWLAGLLATFGIYTGGNVITKRKSDNGGKDE